MGQQEYDSDDYNQEEESYFCIERPIEELPTFCSHIYRAYSPISVETKVVTDDISYRLYYGVCPHCTEDHYLGTVVMCGYEPTKLYARVK